MEVFQRTSDGTLVIVRSHGLEADVTDGDVSVGLLGIDGHVGHAKLQIKSLQ